MIRLQNLVLFLFALLQSVLTSAEPPLPAYRDAMAAKMFKPVIGAPVEVRDLGSPCTIKGYVVADEERAEAIFREESCFISYGKFANRTVALRATLPAAPNGYYPAGQRLRLFNFNPE